MVIFMLALVTAASIVLIKAHRKNSTAVLQEATATKTNLLSLLVIKDEKEFERSVQVLLEELNEDAIFVIENRAKQLEEYNKEYFSRYDSQKKALSECLEGIISSTPKKIRKRQRFKRIENRLRFYLINNEPLRFFILLEGDQDETTFMEFYEFLIEKDLEKVYREKLKRAATIYCQIRTTLQKINKSNDDLISFNKFLSDNSALIETLRKIR